MLSEKESQELCERCLRAEEHAKTLAECLEIIAGKFSPLTAGLVGMRLNRAEGEIAIHGERHGTTEKRLDTQQNTIEEFDRKGAALAKRLHKLEFAQPATTPEARPARQA